MSEAAQPKASRLVQTEWLHRVEAEYRSSVLTQHLTLWLTQAGSSPDLIHGGLVIAADEIDHADLSMAVHQEAGGEAMPSLSRDTLVFRTNANEPLEFAITRLGVDAFCLGETVAVPLFRGLREKCDVPVAKAALDRILRDEVRHRDFGWSMLDWLLSTPSAEAVRGLIARELPQWFARLWASYAPPSSDGRLTMADDDRRWGLMPSGLYREVLERTFTRDWQPRFGQHGIDPTPAWESAKRR